MSSVAVPSRDGDHVDSAVGSEDEDTPKRHLPDHPVREASMLLPDPAGADFEVDSVVASAVAAVASEVTMEVVSEAAAEVASDRAGVAWATKAEVAASVAAAMAVVGRPTATRTASHHPTLRPVQAAAEAVGMAAAIALTGVEAPDLPPEDMVTATAPQAVVGMATRAAAEVAHMMIDLTVAHPAAGMATAADLVVAPVAATASR